VIKVDVLGAIEEAVGVVEDFVTIVTRHRTRIMCSKDIQVRILGIILGVLGLIQTLVGKLLL
jgi:hypothetical protein